MTHSIVSSFFAQVQQGLTLDMPHKALITINYSSSLFHTRIRGNLRAIAAIAGIAAPGGDLDIVRDGDVRDA
ncbi:MAG: hypothetical protein ABSD21_01290 [Rhizomicrobium sp.]|jgi:hypothetical protein